MTVRNSREVLRALLDAIDQGVAVAQATVVETHRSVPRHAGARMLVYADGRTEGTVGGGELEARVVAEGRGALADGRSRLVRYELVDRDRGDPGVCGGEMLVHVEPHLPDPTVYVVGCGHVGRAVVELASWLGFRVVVTDDREGVLDGGLPDGAIRIAGPIEDALAAHPVTPHTHVVVVARGMDADVAALPALLASPARSIGVMGSRRRRAAVRARLVEAGVPEEHLARLGTLGLDLRAETPQEIAVSILGEIIGMRRRAPREG
jgi:xanthine dehydrogenase accessory factor